MARFRELRVAALEPADAHAAARLIQKLGDTVSHGDQHDARAMVALGVAICKSFGASREELLAMVEFYYNDAGDTGRKIESERAPFPMIEKEKRRP